jgi:DNA-binding NarL/FixJ family response regulator
MMVVATAGDGREAVELCQEYEPDVVLMDITMPVMDGIAATRRVRDLLPGAGVLILTVHSDDYNVFRGLKAGAKGYLLKHCTRDELIGAIRSVHAGGTILSSDVAGKMLSLFEAPDNLGSRISPPLTERELQIIKALAQGKSNKEVARTLGISERTVRNHASNIYTKLHVFDRTQAVLYAVREGLIDLDNLDLP